MGQYKFYINYSFRFLFGFDYEKNYYFQIYLGPLVFGLGLTPEASGFGVWRG